MTKGKRVGVNFGTNLGNITREWSLTDKRTAAVDNIDADADRNLSKDDKLKFLANIVDIDLYSLRCSEDYDVRSSIVLSV